MSGLVDRVLQYRNRFPAAVNRAIDYVADHPMSLFGRLAARRLGTPRELPGVSTVDDRPVRVLIAPVNYSGQGDQWARSLERFDSRIAARNMAVDVPGGFSFTADLAVPVPAYHNSAEWQRRQFAALGSFTHVLVEAEEPLLGRLFGRDPERELQAMTTAGIDVAFLSHGTDARLPSTHARDNPWSPYRDRGMYLARAERLAAANIDMLSRCGRPVFVSTPDLLKDLPQAFWCPVVVDPGVWAMPAPEPDSGPLRVVHAPSSQLVKGTHLIEPMLRRLHDRRVIDYRPIVGIPFSQMPAAIRGADVVLDQFRIGSYGVAACEAMAAGRTVIGHVLPSVREEVEHVTGLRLPVLEAAPDTLEAVLEELAADRARLIEPSVSGPAFVLDVHDGRRSADILWQHWLAPEGA